MGTLKLRKFDKKIQAFQGLQEFLAYSTVKLPIPAGTGMKRYRNTYLNTDFEKDEAPAEDPEELSIDEDDEIINDIDETADDAELEEVAEDTVSVEE